MQVYIEDAVFNSAVINGVILFLTQFSLKQKIAKTRTIFTACFGSVLPIILQYFVPNIYDNWVLKIALGLFMCAFLQKKFIFKNYFLFFLVFLSMTFLLGGFCFFVLFLIKGEVASFAQSPPVDFGVIVLLVGIYTYFLINVIRHFYKRQKIEKFYYDIKIMVKGNTCVLRAYLDSGNFLQDKVTNLPVAIINLKSFLKLFNDKSLIVNFFNGNLDCVIEGRYIEFYSVSARNKIFVFKPDKVVEADKNASRNFDLLIGVGVNCFNNQDFDMLLSPQCF